MYEGFINNSCAALSAVGAIEEYTVAGKVMFRPTASFNQGQAALLA